ncbi:hypothetical protein ACQWF9_25800 [Salmonella enterica subsp. enterica serovar Infantis]
MHLKEQIRQHGVIHILEAGIVFTGGGAKIDGLGACAEGLFHPMVRFGAALNIRGLSDYAQEHYY